MTLSAPDRRILADVHHWARANGWTLRFRGWTNAEDNLVVDHDEGEVKVWRRQGELDLYPVWPTIYRVDSVQEAIDILAALRILPAELSSAYAIGAVEHQNEVGEIQARVAELENMLAAADESGAFATAMDYLR